MNWDGRQSVFDHLGKLMPEKEAVENSELVWNIIGKAMKYSNDHSASIPASKSLYNFFEEEVEAMFPSKDGDETAKRKRETILESAEMWGAFVGSPVHSQSLKFFWLEECIDGENLFVAGTYEKVLQKIADSAQKADVKFGHKVKRILSWQTGSDPKVLVETEGKGNEIFDEVVMTAPLGWLKRNMSAFEPPLPPRLKQGIESIGYGHLDKASSVHPISPLPSILTYTRSTSPSRPPSGTTPLPPHQYLPFPLQAQKTPPSPT